MTRPIVPKHIRELLSLLPGWRFAGRQGNTHFHLSHPSGARLAVSSTPGCRRLDNVVRNARRALRDAEQRHSA